ncbi:SusE domain-containing protein [Carboxylicivirga caseinilyticus]|uniref:SusE domain-containing protein n=1 Tax=Carboxylicivirga caseinilyticus TaxID=3417572 RepID=UPI003D33BC5C|nr:SusE domain-containing protein [Marinilabiliaceae bacterium A049]
MKKLNILTALLAMILVWSCEEKSNLQPEGNWELSSPTTLPLNDNNSLVLDEEDPFGKIVFSWNEATSTENYGVYYTVLIDSLNATDASSPILSFKSLESGKSTSATVTNLELNDALYMAGFKAGEALELKWTVVANCLSKSTSAEDEMTITRYDDDKLFIAGTATEAGDNVSSAILMKRLFNGAGEKLKLYESYTELTSGDGFMVYNGRSQNAIAYGLDSEGKLVRDGEAITVDEDGIYQISIDFDAMSISFYKIDRLALIGSPLAGGWGSDEALTYQGMGVWQSDISFVGTGGYIIRANNNWEGIIKKVSGTVNEVVREDFGNAYSIGFEDFQQSEAGYYTVTLTLTGDEYSINLEKAPDQRMYLIVNGTDSYEMSLIGEGTFKTKKYLALQTTDQLTVNTASDGSGTSYSIAETIGEGSGDKVSGSTALSESSSAFSVILDQMYSITVDINNSELSWHYYTMKLFHWDDDADGGWDARIESEMTYVHPYTFTVTADCYSTHESKFNSPWDISFGADNETALSGTMTNQGGANFRNITTDGTYDITITVADDYSTGTYEFVMQ